MQRPRRVLPGAIVPVRLPDGQVPLSVTRSRRNYDTRIIRYEPGVRETSACHAT